ncbi:hypothetical protein Tco_0471612 [Tanacetum coccineum]
MGKSCGPTLVVRHRISEGRWTTRDARGSICICGSCFLGPTSPEYPPSPEFVTELVYPADGGDDGDDKDESSDNDKDDDLDIKVGLRSGGAPSSGLLLLAC